MDWTEVEARFKKDIISVPCVGVKDGSRENQWKIIHDRVIEHVFFPFVSSSSKFPKTSKNFFKKKKKIEYSSYFKVLFKN